MNRLITISILFLLGLSSISFIPPRPDPPKLVNNLSKEFPSFLNSQESNKLESKLDQFDRETSNQICIVIVDDFGGTDENDFGTRLFNEWGIGKASKENGVLILIKPTGTGNEKRIYIVSGYGLESVLTDLRIKQIISEEIAPYFKQGQFYNGLDNATNIIMQIAKGEYNEKRENKGSVLPVLVFIGIVILFIILTSKSNGNFGGQTYGGGGMFTGGGFGGGFFGGGSSFGGGGGGFGGFGGFGGGRSGGGGAGGSW